MPVNGRRSWCMANEIIIQNFPCSKFDRQTCGLPHTIPPKEPKVLDVNTIITGPPGATGGIGPMGTIAAYTLGTVTFINETNNSTIVLDTYANENDSPISVNNQDGSRVQLIALTGNTSLQMQDADITSCALSPFDDITTLSSSGSIELATASGGVNISGIAGNGLNVD